MRTKGRATGRQDHGPGLDLPGIALGTANATRTTDAAIGMAQQFPGRGVVDNGDTDTLQPPA